jgi:hypothetical protein
VLFGGALSSTGSGNAQQTKLPEQMVSSSGTISVPFIGDVSVLGKTPVQVQNIIKGRLKKMANQPQHALARSRQRHTHTITRTDNRYIRRIILHHAHHYLDCECSGYERTADTRQCCENDCFGRFGGASASKYFVAPR